MVEDVKELGSERKAKSLGHLERLVNREIKIHQVWTTQHRAAGIAEHVSVALARSESGNHKSRLIEPAIESLMAGVATTHCGLLSDVKRKIMRVVDLVRTRAGGAGVCNVAAKESVEGLSAAHRGYSADLPSAQHGLRHAVGGAAEMFPLAVG